MPHVVIIGGGIAGLATAWYLQRDAAAAGVTYTLIERAPRLGGTILTHTLEDLVVEGGPDSFVTQKPWGLQICRELGLADRLIPVNERPVYVLWRGRLVRLPAGFRILAPTDIWAFLKSPLFSPLGKLRILAEPLIKPRLDTADESVADFLRRRVGEECLHRVAGPIMAGIYVSEPERLSMASTFSYFADMERKYGSMLKAFRVLKRERAAARAKNPGAFNSPFASLRGGMSELVETLAGKLTGTQLLGTTAQGVARDGAQFVVTLAGQPALRADAVVLAAPSYVAADLIAALHPALATGLRAIAYVSTATVSLAYRRSELTPGVNVDGLGFLAPRTEQRKVLACTFSSSKFNHRAPEDSVLIRVFVGGELHEDLVDQPDAALTQIARDELAQVMGLRSEPFYAQVFRWPKANPQYDVGHLERVDALEQLAAQHPGLYLTGSAYRGVGIPGCVGNAQRTVAAVCQQFGVPPRAAAPRSPP